jgi:hypothetical protein
MNSRWQNYLNTLPPLLAAEFVDERPVPDEDDIQWITSFELVYDEPVRVSLKELLKLSANQEHISRSPIHIIHRINQDWGLNVPSFQCLDRRPERYELYSQMPGSTANPSVMVNGELIFGVGRFVAALLRKDKYMLLWSMKT